MNLMLYFRTDEESSISLMKEKAIASTAIVDNGGLRLENMRAHNHSRQRFSSAGSYTCGLSQVGGKVVYHARRVSRGALGI